MLAANKMAVEFSLDDGVPTLYDSQQQIQQSSKRRKMSLALLTLFACSGASVEKLAVEKGRLFLALL